MYSFHRAHIRKQILVWALRLILIGILGFTCLSVAQEKLEIDLIETVTQAKQAVDENPTSRSARLDLGFAYLELGSMRQAEAEFKSVVRLDPHAPSGYYWLGGVYFLQARYEDAINVFQRALERLPGWGAAYHVLGMSHFERHNHDAAEIAFNRALNLMQKPQSSRYEVLVPSYRTGGYGWNIQPSPANVFYFLGLIASQRGSLDKAKEYWRQAIETGPPLAEVYFELGVAYNKDKRWEKSVRVLREAIPNTARDACGTLSIGTRLSQVGQHDRRHARIGGIPTSENCLCPVGRTTYHDQGGTGHGYNPIWTGEKIYAGGKVCRSQSRVPKGAMA